MQHWPMPLHSPSKQRFPPARHIHTQLFIHVSLWYDQTTRSQYQLAPSSRRLMGAMWPDPLLTPASARWWGHCWTSHAGSCCLLECWWPGRASAAPRTAVQRSISSSNYATQLYKEKIKLRHTSDKPAGCSSSHCLALSSSSATNKPSRPLAVTLLLHQVAGHSQ